MLLGVDFKGGASMFYLSYLERVLEFLVRVGRLRNCRF